MQFREQLEEKSRDVGGRDIQRRGGTDDRKRQHVSTQRRSATLRSVPRTLHHRRRTRQVLEGKRPAVLLLPRARRFRPGEGPYSRRAPWEESVMKRCHYCGGKLGLIVHRKWSLRFCKLACKKSYECRQSQQIRHRRRWLDTSVLKSELEGAFHRD